MHLVAFNVPALQTMGTSVKRWLSSPVVWTLIVLILSSLGIFRELL
jgi:hypothetical protein